MTSSEIFKKRKFLWDKDIIEWKVWSCSLLALDQDFDKGRGRKLIVRNYANAQLRKRVEYASVLKRTTDGDLGAEPPAAGGYGGLGAKPPAAGRIL